MTSSASRSQIISVYVTKVRAHNQDNWFHDTAPALCCVTRHTWQYVTSCCHVCCQQFQPSPRLCITCPWFPPSWWGGWRAAAGGDSNCDLGFRWSLVMIVECVMTRSPHPPVPCNGEFWAGLYLYCPYAFMHTVHYVHGVDIKNKRKKCSGVDLNRCP